MHIIHIASELAPVAKVGGLGDVLLGLSRELSWKGHDVDIIIPKYDCMDSNEIRDMTVIHEDLMSYYDGEWFHNTVWMGWVENLRVYFIDPHHPRHFFNRGCFYGCEDDIERYLYFCRASMEFLSKKELYPEILHLHDWHTAVIPALYKEITPIEKANTKMVFTIHNIEYQGLCSHQDLVKIGLNGKDPQIQASFQDLKGTDLFNLVKGAIECSEFITTVSPSYAEEVKTAKEGRGLESILIKYQNKFKGILNGVDYSYWNPEIDRHLPAHYSPREIPANKKDKNTLDKKAYIKNLLRERFSLTEDHRPIIGCVTRLVPQKGLDLIKHAITYAADNGCQFVLLGSSPIPSITAEFQALKHYYEDSLHVHLALNHQEELAHLIFAASDMLIVPSLFEPCGLTQLIALKYGAVPIVRRTGGLGDSIFDVDNSELLFEKTNGYVFDLPTVAGIESALKRAVDCWFHHPDKWRKLMINGMCTDYSWNKSAGDYLDIYEKLMQKPLA